MDQPIIEELLRTWCFDTFGSGFLIDDVQQVGISGLVIRENQASGSIIVKYNGNPPVTVLQFKAAVNADSISVKESLIYWEVIQEWSQKEPPKEESGFEFESLGTIPGNPSKMQMLSWLQSVSWMMNIVTHSPVIQFSAAAEYLNRVYDLMAFLTFLKDFSDGDTDGEQEDSGEGLDTL